MNNYYKLIAASSNLADPSKTADSHGSGLRHGVTGSSLPLPDKALVLVNVFHDHVRLGT
jgi:hypothetical protein